MKTRQPGSQKLAWGDPIFNQGRYVLPNQFSTSCFSYLNKRKQQKFLLQPCALEILSISSLWK
jgi:hypothetical protein